jgi:hypothetical protein
MAILGLDADKKAKAKSKSKKGDDSQAEEARALLEKMEAKKNADECPFC